MILFSSSLLPSSSSPSTTSPSSRSSFAISFFCFTVLLHLLFLFLFRLTSHGSSNFTLLFRVSLSYIRWLGGSPLLAEFLVVSQGPGQSLTLDTTVPHLDVWWEEDGSCKKGFKHTTHWINSHVLKQAIVLDKTSHNTTITSTVCTCILEICLKTAILSWLQNVGST